ncbi:MAG: biotin/lipoyl-binding protein [Dermatophilaceae bacterium]
MTQQARPRSPQPPEGTPLQPDGEAVRPEAQSFEQAQTLRQYSLTPPVAPQAPAEPCPAALTQPGAELAQSAKPRRFSRLLAPVRGRLPSPTGAGSGRLSRRGMALVTVVVLLVAAGGATAWARTRPSSAAPAAALTRLATVSTGTVQQTVSASGTIAPTTTSNLSFGAAGVVTAVKVTQGQKVKAGQQLATISSASLVSQVAQAKSTVASTQARLSTDQSASASAAQITADQASITVAQAQLADAQAALAGATLTSPIAGTVTTVNLVVGQQLSSSGSSSASGSGSGSSTSAGSGQSGSSNGSSSNGSSSSGSSSTSSSTSSTGQIQVISTGSYVVNASVGASDLANIAKGNQATITTAGSTTPVFGQVTSVGIVASSSSGSSAFPVVISVTGSPAGLYAGSSATVSIIYKQLSNVLVVPTLAVTRNNGNAYVTVDKNGVKSQQPITVGLSSGGSTQVMSGLADGDTVLVPVPAARTGSAGGTGGDRGFGGAGGSGPPGGFSGTGGAPGANR